MVALKRSVWPSVYGWKPVLKRRSIPKCSHSFPEPGGELGATVRDNYAWQAVVFPNVMQTQICQIFR